MDDKNDNNEISRRGFLELGSAAVAGVAGILAINDVAAAQSSSGEVKTGRTTRVSDPGPTNKALDAANRDVSVPPLTDAGGVPTFKYPFSLSNRRVFEGGWSREVTVRELPVSKSMAGVNMRLTAGGVRELHWHTAAEWAIMLYGSARITAIDNEGRSFVRDTEQGDLWYFPTGIPHSIQGLGPDGAEFLLVFDDGDFSEYATVLLSDIVTHTPKEVLLKNFGISKQSVDQMFNGELFIFQAPMPGSLGDDQKLAAGKLGPSPHDFSFRTSQLAPAKKTKGGEVLIVDSNTFKVSTTIAAAIVTIHPGGMRELHWHQNADEWQYFISGTGRMTVLSTGHRARTMNFEAGDVGYVQHTLPHYIENTGNTDLRFLEMFKASRYQDLSLSEWLAHTPPELVMAHLSIDRAAYDAIPREKAVILPE
ncbi:MAG TPA: cupin domain-containing protein [Terriglobales bacterium]|jgi:oxalate decarboxylase|nr:cupin domain-containing protein [Terriglobales bacterium]